MKASSTRWKANKIIRSINKGKIWYEHYQKEKSTWPFSRCIRGRWRNISSIPSARLSALAKHLEPWNYSCLRSNRRFPHHHRNDNLYTQIIRQNHKDGFSFHIQAIIIWQHSRFWFSLLQCALRRFTVYKRSQSITRLERGINFFLINP